jgi:hypothetical protein
MPRGDYDRSSITRASEYEHNRDPAYLAWRAQRRRDNDTVRASRSERGGHQRHQEQAMTTALSEAICETIARTRREIVAELTNHAERKPSDGR